MSSGGVAGVVGVGGGKDRRHLGHVVTNAAMCQLCPHAVRDQAGNAKRCGVGGERHQGSEASRHDGGGAKLVYVLATVGGCPIGRHVVMAGDQAGQVRWPTWGWGVRWWGVPEPLRWHWRAMRLRGELPLCGCSVWLKEHAAWLGPVMRRVVAVRRWVRRREKREA